jgi:hypothetical protein
MAYSATTVLPADVCAETNTDSPNSRQFTERERERERKREREREREREKERERERWARETGRDISVTGSWVEMLIIPQGENPFSLSLSLVF